MNQKKNEKVTPIMDIIRTKSSVRIGVTETTSIAVQKLAGSIEVTRKGRDFLIYDKRTKKLTEILSDNIAYIQYDSTNEQSIESGEGSPSGSEEA